MPNPRKDLTGKKFGFIEVLSRLGKADNGVSLWNVHCHKCGKDKVMYYNVLTHSANKTKSCGCDRGRKRTLRPDRQPRNTPDQS